MMAIQHCAKPLKTRGGTVFAAYSVLGQQKKFSIGTRGVIMRSNFRRILIGGAVAGVLFATAAADIFAQGRGRGRSGDDRAGQQRQDRGDRGNRGNERREVQRPQRQQMPQARQDQRGNRGNRQQVESDRRSQMQQRRFDQNSRRQQIESDRRLQMQQRRSDQNSRRQQIESDRGSRNAGLWQGFPQNQQRREVRDDWRGRDDRRYMDASRNRNDNQRARWNRVGNGTPPWANRNYERPAQNRTRQENRRYERNVRRDRNNIINVWPAQVRNGYGDSRRYRRYQRDGRRYRADRWQDRNRYPAPVYYYTPVVQQWFPVVNYGSTGYNDRYSYRNNSRSGQYYPAADNNGIYYGNDYYGDDRYYDDDPYYGRSGWKEGLLRSILSVVFGSGGGNDQSYAQPGYANNYYEPYYSQPSNTTVYSAPDYYQGYPTNYNQTAYQTVGYGSPYIASGYSDSYSQDLIQRAAATGYCRGYADAQNAQRYGLADQGDPYGYNDSGFGNYAVSFTEQQRLLSQGYELGYRDAMEERDQYGVGQNGGTLDLVSVLLENVLLNGSV